MFSYIFYPYRKYVFPVELFPLDKKMKKKKIICNNLC